MTWTQYLNMRLPERTEQNDDRADINDLTYNFGLLDTWAQTTNGTLVSVNGTLTAHINNTNNPHSTTAAQVGAYTTAQVDALLSALQNNIDGATGDIQTLRDDLTAHVTNYDNPHQVDPGQIGTYTSEEIDALVDGVVKKGFNYTTNRLLMSDGDGDAVDFTGATITEVGYLSGATGNIQVQLDAIASLQPTYELRGTIIYQYNTAELPNQDTLNTRAISLITAEYPNPVLFDTYNVSFLNQDETEGRVCGYAYYDGSTPNGVTGWVLYFVTTTIVALADDTKAGLVRSSTDISFSSGSGTVQNITGTSGTAIRIGSGAAGGGLTLAADGNSFVPATNNRVSLGTSTLRYTGIHATTGTFYNSVTLNGNTITEWPSFDGSPYLLKTAGSSQAVTGQLYTNAGIRTAGDIIPSTNGARDIGTATLSFKDLYLTGKAYANIDNATAEWTMRTITSV